MSRGSVRTLTAVLVVFLTLMVFALATLTFFAFFTTAFLVTFLGFFTFLGASTLPSCADKPTQGTREGSDAVNIYFFRRIPQKYDTPLLMFLNHISTSGHESCGFEDAGPPRKAVVCACVGCG